MLFCYPPFFIIVVQYTVSIHRVVLRENTFGNENDTEVSQTYGFLSACNLGLFLSVKF